MNQPPNAGSQQPHLDGPPKSAKRKQKKAKAAADYPPDFDPARHDPRDPDTWLALYLDQSIPLDEDAKLALLRSMRRTSRKALLPFMRPWARLWIVLITVLRLILPSVVSSPKALHRFIHWGLKTFVSPEANMLILRHFHIGTELLQFIKDNVPGAEVETVPLRPGTLADLIDNVFLQHDLNIYNFVIGLGTHLRETGREITPRSHVNFDAITDGAFPLAEMPDGTLNHIDLQTAIEIYTPVYQLFLSNNDFWRASNSLQLDEVIGVYIARILGTPYHLNFLNNAHPIVPQSTLRAGWRLMLHGLAAEQLHYHLREWKRRQAAEAAADGKAKPQAV
ncbi:MAG TPA: hypothetical protein VM325_03165 [Alphaproteobacteria bacterium]|nr:hypothetical protein [Alphaproteobacteria bacterium]